jgi:hypothetical protein
MSVSRRIILQGLMAAGAGVLATPAPGQLGKIPWKLLFDGIVAAVTGLELYQKLAPTPSAASGGSPRICLIPTNDFRTLHRLCVQLALATNTREYEQAIEPGDGGLVPAVSSFVEKPNAVAWRRLRNDAITFINASRELMQELARNGGVLTALDTDARSNALAQLKQALDTTELALENLHVDARSASASDLAAAKELQDRLRGMPALLARAQRSTQELTDRRIDTKCS